LENFEILQHYSKADLRRLAKGKISEIVGMDANKILHDLSRVLGNYESIKNNVDFRTPPAHTILEILLETDGHKLAFGDLKPRVRTRIREYRKSARTLDLSDPAKGYRLYAEVLSAAWDYEGDLMPAEQNLLRVLRNELEITRVSHQLITAHPQVGRLSFNDEDYSRELEFLSREGIVLVFSEDGEGCFVLSDETAESLQQLWGIELERDKYLRMLEYVSRPQLVEALRASGLRLSGNRGELVARLIGSEVKPSDVLAGLSVGELGDVLGELDLTKAGSKNEKTLRIIEHFRYDRDILQPETEQEVPLELPEEILLPEDALKDLLGLLGVHQLADVLAAFGLKKSGSKSEKIERLAQSRYNATSILGAVLLGDLRELAGAVGARRTGNKPDLIDGIVSYYRHRRLKDSPLATPDLLTHYESLSEQDQRVYGAGLRPSTSRIALDFERATRYIFKNVFKLHTKIQKAGMEEPDGFVTGDDGSTFCYECKTVLCPPYRLPIAHRLQIRNYMDQILNSRNADGFQGYVIIAHSFTDDIERRLAAIHKDSDCPVCVVTAGDLLAFARKWEQDHPVDTYHFVRALKHGRLCLRDLESATWG